MNNTLTHTIKTYFEMENKIVVSQTTPYTMFKGSKTLGMLTKLKIENAKQRKIIEESLRKSIWKTELKGSRIKELWYASQQAQEDLWVQKEKFSGG